MCCQRSCPNQFEDMNDWCPACRAEWIHSQERDAEIRRLADAWDAQAAIPPATAEEWLRHLDEIAPAAEVLANVATA